MTGKDRRHYPGKAIRIVRGAQEMGLGELAKRSKISTPFLSLVERGERQPSLAVLRRLAGALGVPADALILLSQPLGGKLKSGDRAANAVARAVWRVISAENDLRLKLA